MKRVVITGGASGLGKAMVEYYASQGWSVCIADIQKEAGETLVSSLNQQSPTNHLPGANQQASAQCIFHTLNVTSDQDWCALRDTLNQQWQGVDLLINNAGVASSGKIDNMTMEDFSWTLDINLLGVAKGCHYLMPLLKQSRGGIINIASMAGLLHMEGMSAYNASKAGVVALSETLHAELGNLGLKVMVVCPGFFRTNLTDTMRTADKNGSALAHDLMNKSKLTSEDIAQQIYQGYEAGQFMLLPHKRERRIWMIKRFLPRLYLKLLAGAADRLKAKMAS